MRWQVRCDDCERANEIALALDEARNEVDLTWQCGHRWTGSETLPCVQCRETETHALVEAAELYFACLDAKPSVDSISDKAMQAWYYDLALRQRALRTALAAIREE